MTKQEIITLLIKDYEEAIEKCKGMRYGVVMEYLNQINLHRGICFAARNRHYTHIYGNEWVARHGGFWTKIPLNCKAKNSIIASLQTRLDILKTELEIPE